MFQKFNCIKSIIPHIKFNTRLILNKQYIKFNVSFVFLGVFFDNIDFVKFLLTKRNNYEIDRDYCYYESMQVSLCGVTPLYVAVVYTRNYEMINILIDEYGAIDINIIDNIVFKSHETENEKCKYYDFLISRGIIKMNFQNNETGDTALHAVIKNQEFNLAIHLIKKCGANPFLFNNQNRDGIIEFIVNVSQYRNSYRKYIKKLLLILTFPSEKYKDLIDNLVAACMGKKFTEKSTIILHNDTESKYWRRRFNKIVSGLEYRYVQSVKVFHRLLNISNYNCTIYTILRKVLPYCRRYRLYDKYNKLSIYLLDLVTNSFRSHEEKPTISIVYRVTLIDYLYKIYKNVQFLDKRVLYKILNKIIKNKNIFEIEHYNEMINIIHKFIYRFYNKYNEILYINCLLTSKNESVLHTIIKNFNSENIKSFLSLDCFKNLLNVRDYENNETPLLLALRYGKSVDILKLLLGRKNIVTRLCAREINEYL